MTPQLRSISFWTASSVMGLWPYTCQTEKSNRDARHVLVDLAANLVTEDLADRITPVLSAVNDVVSPAVTEDEVRGYYRSDARLWEVMLRPRHADRWWQSTVRRRPYPFLLPGPIER